jgi:uncharacterized protein
MIYRLFGPAILAAVVAFGSPAEARAEAHKTVTSLLELRQANVVMQKWDISCGAAALATVLTYSLDHPVSEETIARSMLRQQSPERVRERGGFSLLDLKRFAEHRGYRGRAYRGLTVDHLRKLKSPIVPIQTHGYSHFVVVRGIDGDRVQLADPAFGNRRLPVAKFERVWLGGMGFIVVP